MNLEQYKHMLDDGEPEKKNKFRNHEVILTSEGMIYTDKDIKRLENLGAKIYGMHFQSELEARYYRDALRPRIIALEIDVELQPKFVLLKGFTSKFGVKHLPITYSGDFRVTERATGFTYIVDTKGFEDSAFPLKRKLFDDKFPELELRVIKWSKVDGGWVAAEIYRKAKAKRKRDKTALAKKAGDVAPAARKRGGRR